MEEKSELQTYFEQRLSVYLKKPSKRRVEEIIGFVMTRGIDYMADSFEMADFVASVVSVHAPKVTAKKIKDDFDLVGMAVNKDKGFFGPPYIWSNGQGNIYATNGRILTEGEYDLVEGWYCPKTRVKISDKSKPAVYESVLKRESLEMDEYEFRYFIMDTLPVVEVIGKHYGTNKTYRLCVDKKYIHPTIDKVEKVCIAEDLVKLTYKNSNAVTLIGCIRNTYKEDCGV